MYIHVSAQQEHQKPHKTTYRMSAHPKATQSTFRQSLQMMRFFKEVPNSKNTVRDQLANERSFLAFARASIMLLASVISITQVYKKILIQDQVKQLLNLPSDDTHQSSSLLKAYIALNSTYSTIVRPLTIFATAASLIIAIMGFFRYILNLNLLLNDKRFSPFTLSAFVIIIFCAVVSI